MRRYSKIMLAALAGILALGSAAPAAADGVSFSVGSGFTVGGVSFHVAYASPRDGYAPYYYRTSVSLQYQGYRCSSYCRREGRYWYHAPNCPLVAHHFSSHGYQGYPFAFSGDYPVGPPPRYDSHGYGQRYRSDYGHGYRSPYYGGQRHGREYGRSESYGGHSRRGSSKHGYSKRGHGRSRGKHNGRSPGGATRTRPRHN